MAKNHQTENALFKALAKKYEADIASGYATLLIYFDKIFGRKSKLTHPKVATQKSASCFNQIDATASLKYCWRHAELRKLTHESLKP